MIKWGDFRDGLREDIRESADSPRLTDALMYLYFKHAMADYSLYNPRLLTVNLPFNDSDNSPLPSDFISVDEFHIPQGRTLEELAFKPGRRYKALPMAPLQVPYRPTYFWILGGLLWINKPTNEVGYLVYNSMHEIPHDETDINCVLSFPDVDEATIGLYIKGRNATAVRTRQANLDRYKDKNSAGNTRLDNPMGQESNELMDEYRQMMNRRYSAKGGINLYRPGRGRS